MRTMKYGGSVATINEVGINKDQLALPLIPAKKTIRFRDVKPGEFFRKDAEGFIFYCSRGQDEWQGNIVYRVYANRNIPMSFTERDIPPDDEVVDIIDSIKVRAV